MTKLVNKYTYQVWITAIIVVCSRIQATVPQVDARLQLESDFIAIPTSTSTPIIPFINSITSQQFETIEQCYLKFDISIPIVHNSNETFGESLLLIFSSSFYPEFTTTNCWKWQTYIPNNQQQSIIVAFSTDDYRNYTFHAAVSQLACDNGALHNYGPLSNSMNFLFFAYDVSHCPLPETNNNDKQNLIIGLTCGFGSIIILLLGVSIYRYKKTNNNLS
jgi:hypothetical protein